MGTEYKSTGVEKACYLCLYNTQGGVLETSRPNGKMSYIPICAACVRRYDLLPPPTIDIKVDPELGPYDWKIVQR